MKTFQSSTIRPLIKVINDEIIAVIHGAVLILNGKLKTIKRFKTIEGWEVAEGQLEHRGSCTDGNTNYIAVGYFGGEVCLITRNGDDEPLVRSEHNLLHHSIVIRFTNTRMASLLFQ